MRVWHLHLLDGRQQLEWRQPGNRRRWVRRFRKLGGRGWWHVQQCRGLQLRVRVSSCPGSSPSGTQRDGTAVRVSVGGRTTVARRSWATCQEPGRRCALGSTTMLVGADSRGRSTREWLMSRPWAKAGSPRRRGMRETRHGGFLSRLCSADVLRRTRWCSAGFRKPRT